MKIQPWVINSNMNAKIKWKDRRKTNKSISKKKNAQKINKNVQL